MGDHPNAAIVRRACIAVRKGKRSLAAELFAENADFFVPGKSLLGGWYEGREGAFEFYEKATELSGGTLRSYVHDVVANDRHAFAIETYMASRAGRNLDLRDVTIFHVIDGKITTGTRLLSDPYRHDEFWS